MIGYGLYGQKITSLTMVGGQAIAAAVAGGMVKTSSDWTEWRTLYHGLLHADVYAVASDPKGERLYAGTAPAEVFASNDRGENWHPLGQTSRLSHKNGWTHSEPPHTPRIIRLFVHPQKEQCLIGGVQSGGVLITLNGGQTWLNRRPDLSLHLTDLRLHPDRPQRLYATDRLGFYRSDDLGESWSSLNDGLCYQQADTLCVHTVDPDRLLLAVRCPVGGHSVLFRSDNGGERWQITDEQLPSDEGLQVTTLESGGGVYFAGTREGIVFGSRDRDHWKVVRAGLPPITTLCWVGEFHAH